MPHEKNTDAPASASRITAHHLAFEDAIDPTFILDGSGRILEKNRAARGLGDIDAEDLCRRSVLTVPQRRGASPATFEVHVRAADGYSLVVLRDVTEKAAMEHELRELRRVESLGYMMATAVHDFNNLLTPIVCAGALLTRELAEDAPGFSLAHEIQGAAERAAGLVRQVLAFMRREPRPPERVDLSSAVSETKALLERVLGEGVALELALDDAIPDTIVDREQLGHVLLNLAANARDAMPRGGRLTIATARVPMDGSHGGAFVSLIVTDTGVGMPPDVRERVFERFFTTKNEGHGTGLGLAAAHRFVTKSGGCITVRSEPGRGTTVSIFLPCAPEATESEGEPAPRESQKVPRGSETILVVEDDDPVRRVVCAVLEAQGYRVLDAPGADAARRVLGESTVDLLLVDVVLPGTSGASFVEELATAPRAPKVLFMSGHSEKTLEAYGVDGARYPLLRKAFTPADLARAVRDALDRVPGALTA
jgi:two-component system cell cycle sensor histidine kinase/response regulator CckA